MKVNGEEVRIINTGPCASCGEDTIVAEITVPDTTNDLALTVSLCAHCLAVVRHEVVVEMLKQPTPFLRDWIDAPYKVSAASPVLFGFEVYGHNTA